MLNVFDLPGLADLMAEERILRKEEPPKPQPAGRPPEIWLRRVSQNMEWYPNVCGNSTKGVSFVAL